MSATNHLATVDKKDKQILEILAQNCRIAHTTLGAALGVSKDTIEYRIQRLEREELLKQFVLFIDARKLGFTRYHLLLSLEAPIGDLAAVCQKFSTHPYVMWVNTFVGRFDVQIIVDARNSFHLNEIRSELFAGSSHKIRDYRILTHLADLEFTQLNPILDLKTDFERKADHSFSDVLTTRRFPVAAEFKTHPLAKGDAAILNALANDPRMSISEISQAAGLDRVTTRRHILSLIKNGIILNFGGIPNLARLGFVTYYLLVRVAQDTPSKILTRPFARLRNIFYAGRMIGDYDMILYLNARTPEELHQSIALFKNELRSHIIHYDLLVQERVHHWRQFTPGIFGSFSNFSN
jgi:DNA-binding Lrp family transcriptional regulator